jgi:formylglycine-generating enzyme required for sulfatase activity
MRMTLIPPGEFMMGSTPEQNAVGRTMGEDDKIKQDNVYFERLPEEMPQHRVVVSQPFLMGS